MFIGQIVLGPPQRVPLHPYEIHAIRVVQQALRPVFEEDARRLAPVGPELRALVEEHGMEVIPIQRALSFDILDPQTGKTSRRLRMSDLRAHGVAAVRNRVAQLFPKI